MSDNLYQEELMYHFKNPCNRKEISNPDFVSGNYNPSCGDKVAMTGKIKSGILNEIGFTGSGCIISQAAASMLTQVCKGKKIVDILAMTSDDIKKMIGLELGPNRLKCALLALQVLQQGILDYRRKSND